MIDFLSVRVTRLFLSVSGSSLIFACAAVNLVAQAPIPSALPEAPSSRYSASASLTGAVTDPDGDAVIEARVTIENLASKVTHTVVTDDDGLFRFPALEPGRFTVTVHSAGFADGTSSNILLTPDEDYDLPPIALQIAEAMTQVDVIVTTHDIAQEQLHLEEQQRIFAIFPNFYVSYVWKAAPLSAGQKFKLALRASTDPGFFLQNAAEAGIEQWQNTFSGYGQSTVGYFKRFGAASADGFVSGMIGGAVLPSLLHQDPRYFYKGTGSVRSRAFYAVSTVFICRSDKGKWQPNYSNVLGDLASAGISNIYYPASDRHNAGVTVDNALIGLAGSAFSALMQEFVLKKFTPHARP